MAKYTDLQLKGMANEVLKADSLGDARATQFMLRLSAIANISYADVMNRIMYYANRECS